MFSAIHAFENQIILAMKFISIVRLEILPVAATAGMPRHGVRSLCVLKLDG